jgi:hypothetical protein
MKVCSWDVGIKHLAYCVLEKINDTDFKIIKWAIINIIEEDQHKCSSLLKNGNKCNSNGTFCGLYTNNITLYYCGQHKGYYKPLEDDWENKFIDTVDPQLVAKDKDKYKCCYLSNKCVNCGKNAKLEKNNKYYCTVHGKRLIEQHKKLHQLRKVERKKCSSYDPQVLARNMYSKLNEISELLDVDEVLIENQPTLKNPTMKTISSLLFGYFVLKGQINNSSDDQKDDKKIRNVKFINPSNKLKVDNNNITSILGKVNKDDKLYSLVIKLTMKYLELDIKNEELLDKYFDSSDDKEKHVKLILRYLMDKKETILKLNENKLDISIKLKKDNFIELLSKIEKDDKNYDITKALAILYTQVLINGKIQSSNDDGSNPLWSDHLNKYKKKDDVCDAFLQGYHYMYIKK